MLFRVPTGEVDTIFGLDNEDDVPQWIEEKSRGWLNENRADRPADRLAARSRPLKMPIDMRCLDMIGAGLHVVRWTAIISSDSIRKQAHESERNEGHPKGYEFEGHGPSMARASGLKWVICCSFSLKCSSFHPSLARGRLA